MSGAVVLALTGLTAVGFLAVLVHAQRMMRRAVPTLAALACPKCGGVVGGEAAARIAERRAEEIRRFHAEARERGAMVRIDPRWRFDCPSCGAALTWDPGARKAPLVAV